MIGCIVNVGVNASHGSLRSPIFEDNQFLYFPIPERSGFEHCSSIQSYRDYLTSRKEFNFNFLPRNRLDTKIHYDPEFDTFTYGDYPSTVPKASNLGRLSPSDYLFFLSRLVRFNNDTFSSEAGFFIIGYFKIEEIVPNIKGLPNNDVFERISNNAHVKRGQYNRDYFDDFWVFKGKPSESRLLRRALPFDKSLADEIMRDAKGNMYKWAHSKSDLQIIGSYTRTCPLIYPRNGINPVEHLLHLAKD